MNISQEKGVKNVLIMGHTNVVFKWNENEYCVVEIGIDSIEKKDVYSKISEVIYSMPEGISQVLFAVDGKFTAEEIRIFKSFEKEILNSGIAGYITIVRTKFENFKIKKKCKEEKSQTCYENDDDRERVENNKKIRARSRNILLSHLETTCQEKYYKLKTWEELHNKISGYIESNGIENIAEMERDLKLESPTLIIDNQVTQEITREKMNILNVLIVGRTGSGKSALCNVLSDTEEFEESGRSISVTNNFQKKDFKWHGKRYCVVDTVGIDNTRLSMNKVLHNIVEGIYSMQEGLSQVLFVIEGNFTAGETRIFNVLKNSIFSTDILGYVTIVRTKFSNFKNEEMCDINRDQLHSENEKIAEIIKSCRDVIHVDNPPTNIQIADEDDQHTVNNNKKIRKRSREILLNYLNKACQEGYFKVKPWGELNKRIEEYLESLNI
ncbi:hypothetical protein RclHR1_02850011 [Rhizophagus clarus]|uniref:Kinase-like domain-containing protein n=1 Tax=Rhizophagus clarus TaxID=94130 RepID=A0A2Z6R403_9GLOM|nr:hypothetical protein RclHR1_02850011 [Rhizophagus clarus]GES90161.1 kinase-like domain-containing protein [Rhizophagus clarus]